MATKIYDSMTISLLDGTILYMTPLKIKYLREFMDAFAEVKKAKDDDEAIDRLVDCVVIAMQQYAKDFASRKVVEDICDISMIYSIVDAAANIKMKEESEQPVAEQAENTGTWSDFDLAKLEAELFLLGIWKDYEQLELSMSIPELAATLESKRDLDYQEKKFLAAIQGVDLDGQSGAAEPNAWEKLKAKVFSNNGTNDPNDVLALQGVNAEKAGFGIGMGLDYVKIED